MKQVIATIFFTLSWSFAQDCSNPSTGATPLIDLVGDYQGFPGGLYGGGFNTPPTSHVQAGLAAASEIASIDGVIGVASIGMSNAFQEWDAFQTMYQSHLSLAPAVELVNLAKSGWTADKMADPLGAYWDKVDIKLSRAGIDHSQIQVVWLKNAVGRPRGVFPDSALLLQQYPFGS